MDRLHHACRKGDLAQVEQLVKAAPASVDEDDEHGWRPLFHAALARKLDVVRYLLHAGADVAAHGGYVLHYAAEVPNNQEIVTLLLQYGALDAHVRPSSDLARQFIAAIFLNDHERVERLLALHPELGLQEDGTGDLPIHHAARNGSTEIVAMLIGAGASVNAANKKGHTVLYCAAGHGHKNTVELLLHHDVDVDAKFTSDGKSVPEWLNQYPDDSRFTELRKLLTNDKSP